jgi:hypothetical protein
VVNAEHCVLKFLVILEWRDNYSKISRPTQRYVSLMRFGQSMIAKFVSDTHGLGLSIRVAGEHTGRQPLLGVPPVRWTPGD